MFNKNKMYASAVRHDAIDPRLVTDLRCDDKNEDWRTLLSWDKYKEKHPELFRTRPQIQPSEWFAKIIDLFTQRKAIDDELHLPTNGYVPVGHGTYVSAFNYYGYPSIAGYELQDASLHAFYMCGGRHTQKHITHDEFDEACKRHNADATDWITYWTTENPKDIDAWFEKKKLDWECFGNMFCYEAR